jgi:hypothetical protein
MKKSIFIAVLGAASMVVAYGQGKVNFQNYYSSSQTTGISYSGGPNNGLFAGPEISVELYYGDSTATTFAQLTPLASSITQVGLGVATIPGDLGTGAGWFVGGSPVVPSIGLASPGGTYEFAIYAFGGGYSGESALFTGTTAASSTANTPDLPVGLEKGSFTISSVPEPTTLALAGLGGLASLIALRRKQS